jgi:hypothetical protein
MQGFAAILLILQLLAHGVAGCCWHHEHADNAAPTAVAVAADAEKTCCHHRQAAPDATDPANSKQHAPEDTPCDESQCLLGISRNRVDAEIPNQALHFVLATDSCASLSDTPPATRPVCIEDIEPPLRLHALHEVLLI